MPKKSRFFSAETKLVVVKRMLCGEEVRALAKELKVSRTFLYRWKDRYRKLGVAGFQLRRGRRPKNGGITAPQAKATDELESARQRIAELERKIGQQQLELDFFSASLAASQGSTPAGRRTWRKVVYACIQAMTTPVPQGDLTVARMCDLARVSRAGYYRSFKASAPRQEETCVRDALQRIALKNRFYGYRRILVELRKEGFDVNHKRVLRLMRQDNLLCLRKRPFVPITTQSQHSWPVVPNLARSMVPTGPNQLWVADITYVRMLEQFGYLAIVLDAFSRRVIGWALDDHLNTSLAIAALKMAIGTRRPEPGSLVHHSDRGVQYASGDYTLLLEAHGIVASMSRPGNPYDNAKAESFMKTLKHEEVDGSAYRNIRHARRQIGLFIEEVYNRHRLHSALDYRSPIEFEAKVGTRARAVSFAEAMGFQGMGKSTAMNEEVGHASQ